MSDAFFRAKFLNVTTVRPDWNYEAWTLDRVKRWKKTPSPETSGYLK